MPSFFISSTFRDMHPERDLLHKQVFPAIEVCAKQHGDHVNICDLRWGIDTDKLDEQESLYKILGGCLDSIDRCGDYFIAFIGDRYGYVPEKEYLQEIVQKRDGLHLPESPISVTELEITYALSKINQLKNFRHMLFYVREIKGNPSATYQSENKEAAEKIQILKNKLQGISNLTLKDYSLTWNEEQDEPTKESLDTLADLLRKDIQNMLENEWETYEISSAYELDRCIHHEYSLRKCKGIYPRNSIVQECMKHISNHTIFAINGPIGIGKSTIMSQLTAEIRMQGNYCEILYGGYTPLTGTADKILLHLLDSLAGKLGIFHDNSQVDITTLSIPEQLEYLDKWLLLYDKHLEQEKRSFYFLIDAVDQLVPDEYRESLLFLTDTLAECKWIHMVISAVESFRIPVRIPLFKVTSFEPNEIVLAAEKIAGMEFKELNPHVQQCILSQSMSKNPLYLSLLVKRLLLMDQKDFQAIDALTNETNPSSTYQGRLISQLDAALYGISRELAELASNRIGGEMVQKCLSYLAISRYGLTETELEKLFKKQGQQFCYLDFSMFIRYLDIFFIRRMDGKIDFSHQSLRMGILEQYSDKETELQNINHELAVLFSEEPEGPSDIEMYWHLLESGDYESFYENLNLIKTMDEQCSRMAGIVKLWLILRKREDELIRYPIKNRSVNLFNDLAVLINHYIYFLSKSSKQDRLLAGSLEQKLLEAGNTLKKKGIECEIVSNEHFLRNMVIIRNILAEITVEERTEKALWQAIAYLEMNLPYLETEPTDPTLRQEVLYKDRITNYERLSDFYEYIGGKENLEKAHLYLSMAVETVELYAKEHENEDSLMTMLTIYLRMAKQCENILTLRNNTQKQIQGSKEHPASYYYKKSYDLITKMITMSDQHNEDESIYIELLDVAAYGYDSLSEHYFQLRDQKHLKMAEELCLKSIEFGKKINRLQGMLHRKTIQGAAYLRLALIYEELDMDMQEKNHLIEQNLQRGCYIYKSLMEELETPDVKRDYAVSLGRMALHYHDLGDEISLQKGLLCMEESLKIYDMLMKNMPTPSVKDGLAKEKGTKADLLKAIRTKTSLMKAYRIYKEILRLRKELYHTEQTNANLREIAFVYSKLAEILLDIDDERYAKQALALLHKELKILRKIARHGETIENLNDFLDAYEFIYRCHNAIKLNKFTFIRAVQYQKLYIQKCQKSRLIDPCEDTVFNLSVAYENIADLYFHRKGRYHLYKAEKYAKLSYQIFKEYELLCGPDQCQVEWAVFYNHIGAIYLERYGIEMREVYLKKSYSFLHKSLKLNHGTDSEEFLVSIKNLAEHPYTPSNKRRTYLKKSYLMAKKRYQETKLDWYRVMLEDIEKAAKKYEVIL